MKKKLNIGRPKNKRDLIRISTHIPKDHYHLIISISDEEDLSMGQIIRRAIELYLVSQREVLNLEESEIAMANHLTETRSKRAITINHVINSASDQDSNEDSSSIFEELNPDAF